MAKPWIHALSSARRFGGKPEDFLELHNHLDSTKGAFADNRHRAITRRAQREYIDVVPETSELIQIVKSVRSALADTVNKEAMIALQCELLRVANSSRYGREIGEMLFAIHSAIVSLLNADECRFGNDYKGERAQVTECRSGVRKIGKLARQVVLQFELQAIRGAGRRRTHDPAARLGVTEYAKWQFVHLRNFLTELIEKPSEQTITN